MSTSSDRSWIRMYEELNLNKNFVIITFDNLVEAQTFNYYDARSIMLLVIE